MATLDLLPNGINATGSWTDFTLAQLQASDDAYATSPDEGGTYTPGVVALDDAPADFASLNSVTVAVEASISGAPSRGQNLLVELIDSGGSVVGSFTTPTLDATDTVYSDVFTPAAGAADVDGWQIRVTVQEGGGMPGSAFVQLDRVHATLDYEAAVVSAAPAEGAVVAVADAAALPHVPGTLPRGPIRHYRLVQGADPQIAYDDGTQAEDGTLGVDETVNSDDPHWSADGNRLIFDADGERVNLRAAGLPTGNSDLTMITVAMNAKTAGGSRSNSIFYGNGSQRTTPHIHYEQGQINFGTWQDDLQVTIPPEKTNAPVVATFRYTAASLLLEGIIDNFAQSGSKTLGGTPNWGTNHANIGSPTGTTQSMQGEIYYVLIYDRVLTDQEVSDAHNIIAAELEPRGVTVSNVDTATQPVAAAASVVADPAPTGAIEATEGAVTAVSQAARVTPRAIAPQGAVAAVADAASTSARPSEATSETAADSVAVRTEAAEGAGATLGDRAATPAVAAEGAAEARADAAELGAPRGAAGAIEAVADAAQVAAQPAEGAARPLADAAEAIAQPIEGVADPVSDTALHGAAPADGRVDAVAEPARVAAQPSAAGSQASAEAPEAPATPAEGQIPVIGGAPSLGPVSAAEGIVAVRADAPLVVGEAAPAEGQVVVAADSAPVGTVGAAEGVAEPTGDAAEASAMPVGAAGAAVGDAGGILASPAEGAVLPAAEPAPAGAVDAAPGAVIVVADAPPVEALAVAAAGAIETVAEAPALSVEAREGYVAAVADAPRAPGIAAPAEGVVASLGNSPTVRVGLNRSISAAASDAARSATSASEAASLALADRLSTILSAPLGAVTVVAEAPHAPRAAVDAAEAIIPAIGEAPRVSARARDSPFVAAVGTAPAVRARLHDGLVVVVGDRLFVRTLGAIYAPSVSVITPTRTLHLLTPARAVVDVTAEAVRALAPTRTVVDVTTVRDVD